MKRNLEWPRVCAFAAFAMAASVTSLIAISPALGTGAEGVTTFSGSTAGAVAYSSNSSTGSAIQGVTGTVAGGKALWGLANNALHAGTGVRASAYGPSSFGLFGEATNTDKTHPSFGVYATSKSGYAVYAATSIAGLTSLYALNTDATAITSHAIKGQSRGDAITGVSTISNGV